MKKILIDETGNKHGRWTVVSRAPNRLTTAHWNCVCECGKVGVVAGSVLRHGKSLSCGCFKDEAASARLTTHGMSTRPEFHVWKAMLQRCTNPNSKDFKYYGGRGIKVCEKWSKSFVNFLSDIGSRPFPSAEIDRYPDNNGNYEPGNVRWATHNEQMSNTRSNRLITFRGITKSASQWGKENGIPTSVILDRINNGGWSEAKAITTPKLTRK